MVKAVLFDFDGTLANSLGHYVVAYQKTVAHYGFTFTENDVINKCFARTEEEICENLGLEGKADEFRSIYYGFIKQLFSDVKLFPDALKTLKHLKDVKIKIGITTFSHRWYIDMMVDQLQIKDFFQSILSFNDVVKPKPDPEIVLKSCRILNVDPVDTLVVGDAKGDMLMGKAAGAKTVLHIPNENKEFYNFEALKEETTPDYAIKNLSELLTFF